jgi:hypothetical protein
VQWGTFTTAGWSSPPVWVAQSFLQRWKGLRPTADGLGMLIRGRSVHGFGMKEPLHVVGLNARRCVVGVRILHPRHLAIVRGARHILELPIDGEPPPAGAVLTWARGGSPDLVRNTNRQPE